MNWYSRTVTILLVVMVFGLSTGAYADATKPSKEGPAGFRLDPMMVSGQTGFTFVDASNNQQTRTRSFSGYGMEAEARLFFLSIEVEIETGSVGCIYQGKAKFCPERSMYDRIAGLAKAHVNIGPNVRLSPFYGVNNSLVSYPLGSSQGSEVESFIWEGPFFGAQTRYQLTQSLSLSGEVRYAPEKVTKIEYRNASDLTPRTGTATDLTLRADYDFGRVGRVYGSWTTTSVNNDLGTESGSRVNIGISL